MTGPAHLADGRVPKHEQLRGILTDLVTAELAPGDRLPSERRLCTEYGVSRITVREAIGQLVSDGLLVRAPGKGTFVADRMARSRLHLASFHEDMRRLGLQPATVVLQVSQTVPPPRTAQLLGLAAAASAYHVRRLRLADGVPMSVDDAWYDASVVPDLGRLDLTGSIYDLLARRYGRAIDHADQSVRSTLAGPEFGPLLGTAETAPVLVFDRVASSRGQPVEHTHSRYRGDRYEILMSLDATPAAP